MQADTMKSPDFGAFCRARRDVIVNRKHAKSDGWQYTSAAMIAPMLMLRLAPAFEPVAYAASHETERDRRVFAVIPFPGAFLGAGAGVDLFAYLDAVEKRALAYAGVIVAEPGHDWKQVIANWRATAHYLDEPPERVEVFRADRLLQFFDASVPAFMLEPGDVLEREVCAAAKEVGLPFHSETPTGESWRAFGAVAGGIVDKVAAKRGGKS